MSLINYLKVTLDILRSNKPFNDSIEKIYLDEVWQKFKEEGIGMDEDIRRAYELYKERFLEKRAKPEWEQFYEIMKLKAGPVVLSENLVNRDYMAAKNKKKKAKKKRTAGNMTRKKSWQEDPGRNRKLDLSKMISLFNEMLNDIPGQMGGKKENTSVFNFIRFIDRYSARGSYTALKYILEKKEFQKYLRSEKFRELITDYSVKRYLLNVWEAYQTYYDRFENKQHSVEEDLKFMVLIATMNRIIEGKNLMEEDPEKKIGLDQVGFFISTFVSTYHSLNFEKVKESIELNGINVASLAADFQKLNLRAFKNRLYNFASSRLKTILEKTDFSACADASSFFDKFKLRLKGYYKNPDLIADKTLINAVSTDIKEMKEKLIMLIPENEPIHEYLKNLETGVTGMESPIDMVRDLRKKAAETGYPVKDLNSMLIYLASTNAGDLAYIERTIDILSASVNGKIKNVEQTLREDITPYISDTRKLKDLAEGIHLLTNPEIIELYVIASIFQYISQKPEQEFKDKADFLFNKIADRILIYKKGAFSLENLYSQRQDLNGLFDKISDNVRKLIMINRKKREYGKAADIAKKYIAFLLSFRDNGKYREEIEMFTDILDQTYINAIDYKSEEFQHQPANTSILSDEIQAILSDILQIDKERAALWEKTGKSMPVGMINKFQVLFAALHGESDYNRVIDFFEKGDISIEDLYAEAVNESQRTVGFKVESFFNLYFTAMALNEDVVKNIMKENIPFLEYCAQRLFGAEKGEQRLKKMFPSEKEQIERDSKFIRQIDGLFIFYFNNGAMDELFSLSSSFGMYMEHLVKTKGKDYTQKLIKDLDYVDAYFRLTLANYPSLTELYGQEMPFLEYFTGKIFGRGNSRRELRKIFKKEKQIFEYEENCMLILTNIGKKLYENRDFDALTSLCRIYTDFLYHERDHLKGVYSALDLVGRSELIFYFYSAILDEDSLEELEKTGESFMKYFGKKLFNSGKAAENVAARFAAKNGDPELKDPEIEFIIFFNDVVEAYFEKDDMKKAMDMLERFTAFLEHEENLVAMESKEVYSHYRREMRKRLDALDEVKENGEQVKEIWLKEKTEYDEHEKQRAEGKRREEKKKAIEYEKEQKRLALSLVQKAKRDLNLANLCVQDERVKASENAFKQVESTLVDIQHYIENARERASFAEVDIRQFILDETKELDAAFSGLQRGLSSSIKHFRKEMKHILERKRKDEENKKLLEEQRERWTREIRQEALLEKEYMLSLLLKTLNRFAELIDVINSGKLNSARKDLEFCVEKTRKVEEYLEILERKIVPARADLRKILKGAKTEVSQSLTEVREALDNLFALLEDAEKKETEELTAYEKKARSSLEKFKQRLDLVNRNIEQGRVGAAISLLEDVAAEEMDIYVEPVDEFIDQVHELVDSKGREDLASVLERAKQIQREMNEVSEKIYEEVNKADNEMKKKKALRRQKDEEARKENEERMARQYTESAEVVKKLEKLKIKGEKEVWHAKGLLLESAESFIKKADDEMGQIGEYMEWMGRKVLAAVGHHRSVLIEKFEKLKRLQAEIEKVSADLKINIENEKKYIDKVEKDRAEIESEFDVLFRQIPSLEESIGQWAMEGAEKILQTMNDALTRGEKYFIQGEQLLPQSIGRVKNIFVSSVQVIKRRTAKLRKEYDRLSDMLKTEKEKKRLEEELEENALENHGNVFKLCTRAEEKIKKGDSQKAREILIQAVTHHNQVEEYLKGMKTRKDLKNPGIKGWVEKSSSKITVLFKSEEERLNKQANFLKDEEGYEKKRLKKYKESRKNLEAMMGSLNGLNFKVAEGRYSEARSFLENIDTQTPVEKYEVFVKEHKKELEDRRWQRRKERLDLSIKELKALALEVQKTAEELRLSFEGIKEENTPEQVKSVEALVKKTRELCDTVLSYVKTKDGFGARLSLAQIEKMTLYFRKYEKLLDREIEHAEFRDKISLARKKVEFSGHKVELERKIREARQAVNDAKGSFLINRTAGRKAFIHLNTVGGITGKEVFNFGTGKNFPEALKDPGFSAYFQEQLEDILTKPIKETSENDTLTELVSRVALMDMSCEINTHVAVLKTKLASNNIPDYQEVLIRSTLYKHGINPEENLKRLKNIWIVDEKGIRAEVFLRSFFMDIGENFDEHVKWMNDISELDDKAFAQLVQKGYSNTEEVFITGSFILHDMNRKEGIDFFINDILRGDDEIAKLIASYFLMKYGLTVRSRMEEEKERAIASGGAIPTHQKTRFTLFLPGAFYNNGEFKEHSDKFADRFNLKKVSLGPKDSADSYIDKVFEIVKKYNADSENTIKMSYNKMVVLVPDNVKDMDKLALLSDKGIKFIRVSNETLINSKLAEPEKRSAFQQNTYVIMLLAGLMNRDISRDDDMAQLARILKFYLLSHFKLEEVTAEKYLKALITDDLAVLVKGILLFMPMQHYEMPDYNLISEFLIKA